MLELAPDIASTLKALAAQCPSGTWRTRFAPAPTGRLHLGHLVNAIFVWGLARAHGGRVLLRIEDHDRRRCRPEFERALFEDLEWLGLEADEIPAYAVKEGSTIGRQSDNSAAYERALTHLRHAGLVYGCRCTRRDIAQIVPERVGEESRYPGTCRSINVSETESLALRVQLANRAQHFDDLQLGAQTQWPARQCGDLLVRDRHGQWTYQFAVTVDDLDQEIDVVIRGEDLLASTGRQWQLARLLGRTALPQVLHHPLLLRDDGEKLSKSRGDTGIGELRERGLSAATLFGMAAHAAGLLSTARSITMADLPSLFV